MIQAKHCDLCAYSKRSLENGLTCGLTNKKPTFKNTCPSIEFSKSLRDYLPELLNKIEQLRKRKRSVYLKFIACALIGFIIVVGSGIKLMHSFEMDFNYSDYLNFNGSLLLLLVGFFLLSSAFWILNKYKKEFIKFESDKRAIESVLDNYDIDIKTIIKK